MKTIKYTLTTLIILVIFGLITLRLLYGGGDYYPDLSTSPAISSDSLDIFFEYDEPLGNIAVSAENSVFFTVHPEFRPDQNRLMEIVNDVAVPYPDSDNQKKYFQTVLSLVID